MTFLKKLGLGLAKGLAIVSGISPLFPQYAGEINRIKDTLGEIGQAVVRIEAIGAALALTGAQKLQAVIPEIAQLVLHSDMLVDINNGNKPRKVSNQPLFLTGIGKIAEGFVDVFNSLKDDVNTEDVG